MIDSLAQSYKGYPTREFKSAFSEFVIRFTNDKWRFWELVDPVTLYYRLESSNMSLSHSPVLRCVYQAHIHFPDSDGFQENADELLDIIEDERERQKMKREHQYIALLYKLRSKLVHEGNKPYLLFSRTPIENNGQLPFYYSVGGDNDKETPYDVKIATQVTTWHLVFPPEFLELVFKECSHNYLLYCKEKNLDPFASNDNRRNFRLTWYDE